MTRKIGSLNDGDTIKLDGSTWTVLESWPNWNATLSFALDCDGDEVVATGSEYDSVECLAIA
jgi:hypothetical protein